MKKRHAVLMWALALAACGGTEEQGPPLPCVKVRCDPGHADHAEPEEGAPEIEVAPDSLTKIHPASSLPALGEDRLMSYELASSKAGTLWEFGVQGVDQDPIASGEARVRFRSTTLDGDVQRSSIDPPSKISPDSRSAGVWHVRNSEGTPMVDVAWNPKCSDPTGLCPNSETLAFGSAASEAPERILWDPRKQKPLDGFSARAKGRWIGVVWVTVEQQNLSHELIWRQTAVAESESYLTENAAELLENGEIEVLSAEIYAAKEGRSEELWRIGFDGNVKQRLDFGLPVSGARLVHDTQDRALIAGIGLDGDIHVLRHEGGNDVRAWRFKRKSYTELNILALSVDLADAAYVLAETGAPEAKDRVHVLCRVRADDATDCFAIDKLGEPSPQPRQRIQATGPGIVYVSDGQRLFRYELPTGGKS